jgi:DNA sulfur modification protein DndD
MIYSKLVLYNFGPYKGEQAITFPQEEGRRVMMVFGDNMRGKTSLLNALRWVLHEEALDRHMKEVGVFTLVNTEAQKKGDWKMWVGLSFSVDGKEYELRRHAQPRELVSQPSRDSDFIIKVTLKRNGDILPANQIEHELNQYAPKDISRFSLFDGELLQEYEMLLDEESDHGSKIKEAIEKVLGVPALINGRKELRALLSQAQSEQAKENRHSKHLESLANQSIKLREETNLLENDLKKEKEKAEELESQINEIDDELRASEEIREINSRVLFLKEKRKSLNEKVKELNEGKQSVLADAWKDLVYPQVENKRSELSSKIQGLNSANERQGSARMEVSQVQSILNYSSCPVCEQSISGDVRGKFQAKLDELNNKLDDVINTSSSVVKLTQELNSIAPFSKTDAAKKLQQIEKVMTQSVLTLTDVEEDLEELEEKIRGHDVARISALGTKKDGLSRVVSRVELGIDRTSKDIAENASKLDRLSKLMADDPSAKNQRSAREVEVYDELYRTFANSIDKLRDKLRKKVEAEATKAFLELTTEKNYTGLQINSNYGLSILDRFSQPLSARSAGAEQIVAFSLIIGLSRVGSRSSPIVMDTPFGRLDPNHRLNILKFIPQMGEQVVFLVHEGEVSKKTSNLPIAEHIGAVYEISRITKLHSEIVPATE